jgi:hypothetical protein
VIDAIKADPRGTPEAIADCRTRLRTAQQRALIDIQAENVEAREALRQAAAREAVALCGASSVNAFIAAVEYFEHAEREIDRMGKCLWCGWMLDEQQVCVECKRSNS